MNIQLPKLPSTFSALFLGIHLVIFCISIISSSLLYNGNSSEEICEFMMNESSEYAEEFYISGVPYKYQNDLYWCGPASLAMVLSYWGDYVSQEDIADSVINPADNLTYSPTMVEYAENRGFIAFWGTTTIEELKENISRGPIIVLQRYSSSYENGHFRVVVGYEGEKIITHNPFYLYNYSVYLRDYPDDPTRDYHIPHDNFVELWKLKNSENEFVMIYSPTTPIRDNTPPTISMISPNNGQILENHWAEVLWEGEDQESGIERYEVKMDNWDWNPTTDTSKQFYASDGEHTVYIRAVNRAGNLTEGNVIFTVNTGEDEGLELIYLLIGFVIVVIIIIGLIVLK